MLRLVPALALAAVATSQSWQPASPAARPHARTGHSLAWDAARQRAVLFGGYDYAADTHFQDTWEYDGAAWTQRTTTVRPSARQRAGMCYDEQRGVLVLFGGMRSSIWSAPTWLGDTWEFDGASWQQITPAGAAPAPRLAELAYDTTRAVTVLFGGTNAAGFLADTWEYDGTAWLQRSLAAAPPPLPDYALAFDRRRGRLVAHPGYIMGQSTALQTWEYDGSAWTQVVTPTTPPVLPQPAMTYDGRRERVVLVGAGYASNAETWEFDGLDWSPRQATLPSNSLTGHRMTYDARRGAVVLFGGEKLVGPYLVGTDETWDYAELARFEAFGASCAPAGPVPVLAAQPGSLPHAGATFAAEVTGLDAAALPLLVLGLDDQSWNGQSLPLPLGAIGLPACLQLIAADAVLPLANQAGTATCQLPIPAAPQLHGVRLLQQALVLDAAMQPQAVTNGGAVTVGL